MEVARDYCRAAQIKAAKRGTLLTPDQAKALIQYVREYPHPPPYKSSIIGSLFGEFRNIPKGLTKKLYEYLRK